MDKRIECSIQDQTQTQTLKIENTNTNPNPNPNPNPKLIQRMGMKFEREEFEEWLKRGVKISHGIDFDLLPDDDIPFLLPTSPVAFAMVNSIDDVILPPNNHFNLTPTSTSSMMIPLPLLKFKYGLWLMPDSSCISVSFRGCWSVDFVKDGHFCDFFLALPLTPPGHLKGFRICNKNDLTSAVRGDSIYCPMFDDIVFMQRNQFEGGAQVLALVTFVIPIPEVNRGMFTVPLSFPFYAKNFPRDQRNKKCIIRVGLRAKQGQVLANYAVNYPLKVMFEEEDLIQLCQESRGVHLEWPNYDLRCDYTFARKAVEPRKATYAAVVPEKEVKLEEPGKAVEPRKATYEAVVPKKEVKLEERIKKKARVTE